MKRKGILVLFVTIFAFLGPMGIFAEAVKTITYVTAQGGRAEWDNLQSLLGEYQKSIDSNLKIDRQVIPDRPAYLQKVQTLIAAGSIPDWFDLDATVYAEHLASSGLLLDVEKTLKDLGYYDLFFKGALDYQRLSNGKLYMLPLTYNIEMFWYNKEIFGRYNLKAPSNFDEFMSVCKTLKENGVTPIALAGREAWPIIRYISFVPFRLAGNEYIESLKKGKASMLDPVGMAGINFVAELGTKGYFQEGFATTDYPTAKDLFLSGKAAIWYIGTWEAGNLIEEKLPQNMKGNLDYFKLPMTENTVTRPNDYWAHSGIGLAFSAKGFDNRVKAFFKYFIPKYLSRAVDYGYFPPGKFTLRSDAPALYKRIAADMLNVGQYAMCWDVRMDPVTTDLLGTEINALAQGIQKPQDFAKEIDNSVKENAPKFFK